MYSCLVNQSLKKKGGGSHINVWDIAIAFINRTSTACLLLLDLHRFAGFIIQRFLFEFRFINYIFLKYYHFLFTTFYKNNWTKRHPQILNNDRSKPVFFLIKGGPFFLRTPKLRTKAENIYHSPGT